MPRVPGREHLLSSVQMARFVAHGFLRFDAVVPPELNEQAIGVLTDGIPRLPYGTAVDEAFPEGSFARRLIRVVSLVRAGNRTIGALQPGEAVAR